MQMIQKIRNAKRYLAYLVLMVCSLMITGAPAHAEETADVSLSVNQTFSVTGSTVSLEGGVFTYLLSAVTADTPMPVGSAQGGYQFSIKENQSLEIVPMIYSRNGVYEYRLGLLNSAKKTGYTYDKRMYDVTVYVNNIESDPVIKVIAKNKFGDKVNSLDFEHAYQPLASDPTIMVDPPVKKTVSGNPLRDGIFEFALTAEEKSHPMPEGSEDGKKLMSIQGEGEKDFGVWPYTSIGTYNYTISEVNVGEAGYTYDKTVYTITDVVTDEGGQLVVTRTVTNSDNKQVDTCSFLNQYTKDDLNKNQASVKTGDSTNIIYGVLLLVVTLVSVLVIVIVKRERYK